MIDSVLLSFRNIFRKGLRTAITILGVAVGVASVMLINTISDVGIKTVNNELDSLGLNGISISPQSSSITNEDISIITKQNGVKQAMPILTAQSTLSKNDISKNVMIWGVDFNAKEVISFDVLFGREITPDDVLACENVCLIDESVARAVFGRKNVVGKMIDLYLGNCFDKFKIVGITSSESGILQNIMGNIVPSFCYVPYTTFQQTTGTNELYQIAVKLNSEDLSESVSKAIKAKLDYEKGVENSVKTGNLASGRETLTGLLQTVTRVFFLVGIITLLVAGLGIMTVMLVSVNERTREIGIKKAIGAKFSNILIEFLFEALTICAIGSIIGVLISVGIIFVGSLILNIDFSIKISTLILAFLSAIGVGVVFGLYPACKAAKMKVVDALRE